MKKILRIILISLGAVAAIAGFASLSFGMTSLFSKYRDAKTAEVSEPEQSSKSSSSKDSSTGSSSSSGGASSSSEAPISSSEPPSSSSEEPPQPEEVGLFLSKDKIFLDDEEQGAAQDTITATVTGCDSTVSWLVTSSNYITVAESTTNSGEANTVATTGIFENVENIRVSLTDDPTIYKDISVYYLNIPASLNLNTIGVNDSNGNTVSESVNSGYTSPVTYDQDGIYFESNSYMTNNRYGEFFDTVEEAKSAGKSLLVTASQGSTVKVQFKLKYLKHLVEAAVETTNIPIVLHLDHGADFETCKDCIDGGFTSVMIDYSSHTFEENIAESKKVVEYAHAHGVVVEAELGTMAFLAYSTSTSRVR